VIPGIFVSIDKGKLEMEGNFPNLRTSASAIKRIEQISGIGFRRKK
jgi:hypothetical protein